MPTSRAASFARPPEPHLAVAPQRFYRPELDGIRFVAFGLVFLHHYPALAPFLSWESVRPAVATFQELGWLGVHLFFLLSGFLVTELLRREVLTFGALNLGAFYARRALRIWPLYYFALFVGFIVVPALALFPGNEWGGLAHRHLVAIHFVPFVLFMGNLSTILSSWPTSPVLSPLWSIAVEEQFYLVWPVLIALNPRPRALVRWLLALVVMGPVFRFAFRGLGLGAMTVSLNPFCLVDTFAFGALLSLTLGHVKAETLKKFRPLAAVGILLVPFALYCARGNRVFTWHGTWIDTLFYVGLFSSLFTVLTTNGPASKILGSRPLAYLGKISYGLYVYHYFLMSLVDKWVPAPASLMAWTVRLAGILCLTVIVATLSYFLLEMPFLRWKDRFTRIPSRAP